MPHQFETGSLCTATTCEGESPILKERSATATKRAIVALEIHKIRDERAAVVSEEGRFVDARRERIAVVSIATYISATWALPLRKNTKIDR